MSTYELCESGYWYDTVEATDADEALQIARDNVSRDNYPVDDSGPSPTLYIDIRARNIDDRWDETQDTMVLPPPEPDCTNDEHRWASPHNIVGGCRENPGVFGHGAGLVIHEVCDHCGTRRRTDTWATRPDTGEQGMTEVSYESASGGE